MVMVECEKCEKEYEYSDDEITFVPSEISGYSFTTLSSPKYTMIIVCKNCNEKNSWEA